jgi:hypothetical protein
MPALIVMQTEALAWLGQFLIFLLDSLANSFPTLMGAFAVYIFLLNVSPRFRRKVMLATLLIKGGAKLAYALVKYKTSGTFPSPPPNPHAPPPRVPVVSSGKVMRRPLVKGLGNPELHATLRERILHGAPVATTDLPIVPDEAPAAPGPDEAPAAPGPDEAPAAPVPSEAAVLTIDTSVPDAGGSVVSASPRESEFVNVEKSKVE